MANGTKDARPCLLAYRGRMLLRKLRIIVHWDWQTRHAW